MRLKHFTSHSLNSNWKKATFLRSPKCTSIFFLLASCAACARGAWKTWLTQCISQKQHQQQTASPTGNSGGTNQKRMCNLLNLSQFQDPPEVAKSCQKFLQVPPWRQSHYFLQKNHFAIVILRTYCQHSTMQCSWSI